VTYDYTVQAQTRYNLWMNQIVPDKSFSVQVDSDQPVVVERSQYWDKNQGGTNSPGLTRLSQRWLLPEGSTAAPFDTFILIENPGGDAANVKVTMRSGGRPDLHANHWCRREAATPSTPTPSSGQTPWPPRSSRTSPSPSRSRSYKQGRGRDGIPGIIPSP